MAKEKKTEESDKNLTPDEKALQGAIDGIEKLYGKGSIITGHTLFPTIGRISSGSILLDEALGGGYARGRIIELYGNESSGKTTCALHAIVEAQKLGLRCAFVDVEHAFDPIYATNIGVNLDKLLFSQPDSGEEALHIVELLVDSGVVGLVIVDSVAALVPQTEVEKDIGASSVGRQAALMSQAMRKLCGPVNKANSCVIFLNQIRMKIVMFGNPEVVSGGNALKYYASQRLDIRRKETLTEGDDKVGIKSNIKVAKNKVSKPFGEAQINILFGTGIDRAGELLDIATEKKIVEKNGSWYSYKDLKLGQGPVAAAATLRDHKELFEEIKNRIINPIEENPADVVEAEE